VTSLRDEGLDVTMDEVLDTLLAVAAQVFGHGSVESQSVAATGAPVPSGPDAPSPLRSVTTRRPSVARSR